jgi:YegS/Rv2252/BmrU family lipid kinase
VLLSSLPRVSRDVCLIVNPHAGRGRAARELPRVESALRGLGVAFRVERTTSMEHARELARSVLETGEVAAAMGGDGLTGAVAGELRGTAAVLGVVPGGRGNDFARKLGISFEPDEACGVLVHGVERTVDVADVGGRTYLGIASAGLDSDVQDLVNATRLPLGGLIYVYGAVRALASWRPARWEVVLDGEHYAFTGYSVAVGNSGMFGGGMNYMPEASLDDGLLDVIFSGEAPRRRYLLGLPKVFKAAHVDEPALRFHRAREVTFSADRPFVAYADGDPIAELPATVRVVPRALRVLAPR